MEDLLATGSADQSSNGSRKKRVLLWLSLPASILCLSLGWQAYEHIQDQSDRIK
jgi:hypothetical protein